MKRSSLIALIIGVIVSFLWCVFEIRSLMDTSGKMVGMHPVVIFAIPTGCLLTLFCLAMARIQRSLFASVLSFLPVILLSTPIFYAYQLSVAGWSATIRSHSSENQQAIERTDFSLAQFKEIPYKDDPRMVAVHDFVWPGADQMTAAKDGTFYGFTINGVKHVYICPLRNGCRGVAWLTDVNIIDSNASVRYEYTGTANWYIWTFSA